MFCPNCGAQLADEARFCSSCGSSIESAPRTSAAASPNPNPAEYYEGVPTAPVTPQPTPAKKKSALPIILIAGAVVVCIAVVLILVLSGGGYKDYHDLIRDYFDASAQYDTDEVLDMVHPSVIDYYRYSGASEGDILGIVDDWYGDGYYGVWTESWYVTDVDFADYSDLTALNSILGVDVEDYVDVEVFVRFVDGEEDFYDFDLIQVDGLWYVLEIW